jgi:hypothetical protein
MEKWSAKVVFVFVYVLFCLFVFVFVFHMENRLVTLRFCLLVYILSLSRSWSSFFCLEFLVLSFLC